MEEALRSNFTNSSSHVIRNRRAITVCFVLSCRYVPTPFPDFVELGIEFVKPHFVPAARPCMGQALSFAFPHAQRAECGISVLGWLAAESIRVGLSKVSSRTDKAEN